MKKDNAKKLVTIRFMNYFAYSVVLAVITYLFFYTIKSDTTELKKYYFFINIILDMSIFVVLSLFVLFLIKQFTSDNIILKNFQKTDGYIALIFTIAWGYTINLISVIVAILSISIYYWEYFFSVLLLIFIWLNLFSITRCFNAILIILKHSREN